MGSNSKFHGIAELRNRRELLIGLAAGTVIPLAGCAENAALGRSQFIMVSDDQLMNLSAQAWQQTLQQERVLRDPSYQRRIDRVGSRIVGATGMTHLDWEFTVFDSDMVNAFVLPNGKVGFYRGILDVMDTDDHIATVMGHEAGHIAGRHAAERASQQMAADVGMQLAQLALQQNTNTARYSPEIAAALGAGVQFGVLLPYSREHEYEADRLGVDYMASARYDTEQAIDFWMAMSALHEGGGLEFMSTHPNDDNRIAAMRAHIQSQGYS